MEFLLKVFLITLKIIGYISTPIWSFINRIWYGKPKEIPPIQNDLLLISTIELADKIRNKHVSSVDVVKAYIDRINEINPIVNAVVADRFVDAIEDAKKADQIVKVMNPMDILKKYPLLGVPFTVKENCSLEGMSIAIGVKNRLGMTAPCDGAAVANLRAAGAIPLLISNVPVYCMDSETRNYIYGATLNPHDLSKSTGGSSGGEAALVTSGASLFGVGSDLGGSIRIPSKFCGVFGHKPTGGAVSVEGSLPPSSSEGFKDINNVGPLCRYAEDLPLLLQIMTGSNAKQLRLNEPVNLEELRIFFSEIPPPPFGVIPVQSEIRESLQMAVQYLKRKGFQIKEAPYFPLLKERIELGLAHFFVNNDTPDMLQDPQRPQKCDNLYWELLKSFIGLSDYTFTPLVIRLLFNNHLFVSKENLPINLRKGKELKEQLMDLLGDNGVLLWPTWPVSAVTHCNSVTTLSAVLAYTFPFNWLQFPSTHVPLGKDDNGMPIGIQIVAAPMQDRLCLALAKELEIGFSGWVKPFTERDE